MNGREPLENWLKKFLNNWDILEAPDPETEGAMRGFKYLKEKDKAEYLINEIMKRYL